jgi:hypothetical protein
MKKLILLLVVISIATISKAQYCSPTSTNLFADHQIQYFQVGTFINITSDVNIQEYNDFSDSLIINVDIGTKYYLVMSKEQNPWGSIAGNTLGYSIWIDFDDDSLFSASELVYSEYYGSGVYTYEDTLHVTDSSAVGPHRLRLRNEWGDQPDLPCDALWGGETEDYTINFSLPVVTEVASKNQLSYSTIIYPNPATNNFTIEGVDKVYSLSIFNSLGQLLYKENNIGEIRKRVELDNFNDGLLLIRIEADNEVFNYKLLKN